MDQQTHYNHFELHPSSTIKYLFPIGIIVFLLFWTNYFNSRSILPTLNISMQESAVNIDKQILKHLHFGQKRLITSFLWIKTLIESDLEHYTNNDLNSWLYLRFDTITDLDPLFLVAYQFGGIYLSIVKDDNMGAKFFFEKGLSYYPEDFKLLFYSGTHYAFELDDLDRAIKNLEKIQYHPMAPAVLPSLVARFKAKQGDLMGSFELLKIAYYNQKEDSPIKERYRDSLYAIKAEIDLSCLNTHTLARNCEANDFEGNPYIKNKNGTYTAIKKWNYFRPHRRDTP
ncbi:MAG: hypothetical protein HQK52_00185 [Oligoflexia bacterium]|nr:hypothetical protein [Oligoflexia bacterium]